MIVEELIEELQAGRPDIPVYIHDGNTRYGVEFNTGSIAGAPVVFLFMADANDDDDDDEE